MALPADPTSSSAPFQPSSSDWYTEHTQRTHRNTPPRGMKRTADDEEEERVIPPYNGFKRLRISPRQQVTARNTIQHSNNVDPHYTTVIPQHQVNGVHPEAHLGRPPYYPPSVGADIDQELVDPPVLTDQLQAARHAPTMPYPCRLAPEPPICDTPPPQRLPSHHNDDYMPLDDNTHRIFISDLDAAIAEIEAEERAAAEKDQEAAFFLPDEVEKEIFSGVPEHVLRQQSPPQLPDPRANSQALILYRDPESISVSEEYDAVRKAVHEARQRIRDRKEPEQKVEGRTLEPPPITPIDFGYPLGRQASDWRHASASTTDDHVQNDDYDDAMDIE
ncbi:uncharacterized protein AB675_2531 [Cyphellophora attinorum]|uniref:Uncharacterized protein n=1 Tax=Cyphellophora attinorum TaxID=1664694 RepID=A0A0N1HAT3_9EURO|nr:uncharacterized protein AB675_2531 [Phialophora attinorum]KPI45164.1 hypothetical protein AB675_2531 [Phialophora attinorum]